MLQSLDEVKKVELDTTGVMNGVDNANLMSVDSITPVQTDTDELTSDEIELTIDRIEGKIKSSIHSVNRIFIEAETIKTNKKIREALKDE